MQQVDPLEAGRGHQLHESPQFDWYAVYPTTAQFLHQLKKVGGALFQQIVRQQHRHCGAPQLRPMAMDVGQFTAKAIGQKVHVIGQIKLALQEERREAGDAPPGQLIDTAGGQALDAAQWATTKFEFTVAPHLLVGPGDGFGIVDFDRIQLLERFGRHAMHCQRGLERVIFGQQCHLHHRLAARLACTAPQRINIVTM